MIKICVNNKKSVKLERGTVRAFTLIDSKVKAALVKKYGWDSVEPLTINQLEKKFGEEVYKDLEPYIVEKPKTRPISWDK